MRRFIATLAVLTCALPPAFGAADLVDRVSRTVPLGADAEIRVDATIADVTIDAADRADARVEIERRAPARADFARFPVAVEAAGSALRIGVVQKDEGHDPRLRSTIAITAPATAVFPSVRVFEGRLRIAHVRSAADAAIRRGAIEATNVAGRIRFASELGGIDIRDAELSAGGMMHLRVFNGALRVAFAKPPANARILAVTLNGGITSDIPLTMKDRFGPRFGETTIGTGDPLLSMDVVKGDISVAVAK